MSHHEERSILLSQTGSDRATAYVMSNKILRRGEHLICTWLDSSRQNQWAMLDPGSGVVQHGGTIGDVGVDNHCGAALASTGSSSLYAVTGGHRTPFAFFQLPPEPNATTWVAVDGLNVVGTYPSLVSDSNETLHLAYRCHGADYWTLSYCRRPQGRPWSEPRVLVRASVPGYIYWTNALAVGPEGRLHLVLGNTRQLSDGSTYYGASHIYSDDSGEHWWQFSADRPLNPPIDAVQLALIEGDSLDPSRRLTAERAAAVSQTRLNPIHLQLLLSNPVIDDRGYPWVVLHNCLAGNAMVFHADDGLWHGLPLVHEVEHLLPGYRVHMQSSLSRAASGELLAALMVAPRDHPEWGPSETELVRLRISQDGLVSQAELVCRPNPMVAHWLPSFEQWCWRDPVEMPAFMYTRGINAGGGPHNVNSVNTEVWLQLPPDSARCVKASNAEPTTANPKV